ncbi:ABC transporter ATP-binding protein [Dyella flava]|uniref:ABC transporter ATP-binding protein n=1 Tax=Dyella flava TaxID=1920170 RepID=A0ABS2K023_9GAMM|nr:ABC transporter ATP-binding protein [Dyella flava]MBM7124601.1 ABC transporter ATP-binding protein [Dyella flava]GLQ49254.1 ABC transporter [Dyella flava]
MGAIQIKGLGKAYKQYPSQWARLAEWIVPFGAQRHQKHWVLQDINFEVKAGEAVGIVGSNGAGKSTLLKLITGTVRPTAGEVVLHGRVAAMLELGMGFHPDFTGRQNAIMGGQLLGLSLETINNLMPAIEAFAEIGDYIDQPVRTYSSGMQMRLAFSVATVQRPDILIVDEALSVGDTYFQHKSFDRIRTFRKEGTTLLIVSHDRYAIQTVCDRAILLEAGHVKMEGPPIDVLDYYHAMMAERDHYKIRQLALADGRVATISGTGEVYITDAQLLDESNQPVKSVKVGQDLNLVVSIKARVDLPRVVLGFMITDRLGHCIYGINTHRLEQPLENMVAGEEATYCFRFPARLGKGSYSLSLSLSRFDSHLDKNFEWRDNALMFHVFNTKREDFVGSSWLDAKVDITRQPMHE